MITLIKNKRLPFIFGCLFLFFSLIVSCIGFAQESKKEEKEKVNVISAVKEIQGEVSAIDKQGIAIVYKKDSGKNMEYEIYFPIGKDLKIEHKQSLDQISVGDIVRVQYEELTEELKEGPKASHKAKVIIFLKLAQKKPEPVEPAEENN